jgi:hypothetical protein
LQHRLKTAAYIFSLRAHTPSLQPHPLLSIPHRPLHVVGASTTAPHYPVLILLSTAVSIKVCISILSPFQFSFNFEGGARKRLFEQATYFPQASTGQLHHQPLLRHLATKVTFSNYLKQVTQGSTAQKQILIFVVLSSRLSLVRTILLNRRS